MLSNTTEHFEKLPIPPEVQGNTIGQWVLKRDKSALFILKTDGTMYVIGNIKITDTFTDEEWLEAMSLG